MIFLLLEIVLTAPSRVIGVIMEPGADNFTGMHVVPASIVKIVEMNGMQAVPILLN